jgi:hypothetical protein
MPNLTRASQELFRRTPDECFTSLNALSEHCQSQRERSQEIWQPPSALLTRPVGPGKLLLAGAGTDGAYEMNDWSFSQLCRLAGVGKETVNRLSAETASLVFSETLPQGTKPLQLYTEGSNLRSIHAASYTRLYNTHLLSVVREYATDFEPPQPGMNGSTGLYGGEQDMFCFLIDPMGWTEIGGEAFAPGFFVWNSEVGSRSIGIETFWFQAVCQNHIVWDAVELVEFTRKHTANVHDALSEVRRIIEALVTKRDERRDGFAKVIKAAMEQTLGDDADEVAKVLAQKAIPRSLAKRALEVAKEQGRFTVFAVVDALTRLCREMQYAGERTEADQKVSRLLELAAA